MARFPYILYRAVFAFVIDVIFTRLYALAAPKPSTTRVDVTVIDDEYPDQPVKALARLGFRCKFLRTIVEPAITRSNFGFDTRFSITCIRESVISERIVLRHPCGRDSHLWSSDERTPLAPVPLKPENISSIGRSANR